MINKKKNPEILSPRPWRWEGEFLNDANGDTVCDDGSAAGEYSPVLILPSADATLIQAAPDLLAALIEIHRWESNNEERRIYTDHRKAWEMVEAALHRATGLVYTDRETPLPEGLSMQEGST